MDCSILGGVSLAIDKKEQWLRSHISLRVRMTYIEIIKIQAASGQEAMLKNALAALTSHSGKQLDDMELKKISVCTHTTIPGCFAVHLWWEQVAPPLSGSRFGLSLMHALKSFGLLDHAVWSEKKVEGS